MSRQMTNTLFPTDLPKRAWTVFSADGFISPVCGIVHAEDVRADNGMPLGAVDTGSVDLETDGTIGFVTAFNNLSPRRGPINEPLLGLSIDGQTHILSSHSLGGIPSAGKVRYWGHYPVADMEFEIDAPVSVGLRAWSPFIPGDLALSNTPGAVFELRVRNLEDTEKSCTLAMNFAGPERSDIGMRPVYRKDLRGAIQGVSVIATGANTPALMTQDPEQYDNQIHYVMATAGEKNVRWGGRLASVAARWSNIHKTEPAFPEEDHYNAGASLMVDFKLAPNEERIVRLALVWYAPTWSAKGLPLARYDGPDHVMEHMYAMRYKSAESIAALLLKDHETILKRILNWQEAIYSDSKLPGWLQDSLTNSLHLINETGVWAQAKSPIGDWCREEDGLWAMSEDPRSCPQMECIPCSFYGNLPLVYFFPELALSTLRAYKAYQKKTGQMSWIFNAASGCWDVSDPGYADHQDVLNGACYIEMLSKFYLRTGDKAFIDEFYESAKKCTIHSMNQRPAYGDSQSVSMPTDNQGTEWMENCKYYGYVSHSGGVRLAQVQMTRRLAEAAGDMEFAARCDKWLEAGLEAMEKHLWNEETGSYKLYNEPETGKHSDVVMAYQLDGEWISRFHALGGVLGDDRARTVLDTVKRLNANPEHCPHGAFVFSDPDGPGVKEFDTGYWTPFGCHLPSVFMLGMTYLYFGDEFGMDLVRRSLKNLLCDQTIGWDWPILYSGRTGLRIYGTDYYQDLMLWSLPAAISGTDLSGPCDPGGLVSRIIEAAQERKR